MQLILHHEMEFRRCCDGARTGRLGLTSRRARQVKDYADKHDSRMERARDEAIDSMTSSLLCLQPLMANGK